MADCVHIKSKLLACEQSLKLKVCFFFCCSSAGQGSEEEVGGNNRQRHNRQGRDGGAAGPGSLEKRLEELIHMLDMVKAQVITAPMYDFSCDMM